MKTVEMNWRRAIKVYWFWVWRTLFAAVIVGFIVGLLIGIFFTPFIRSQEVLMMSANVVGAFIAIYFGIFVMRSLPDKQFSDFRIVLVANEREPAQPSIAEEPE